MNGGWSVSHGLMTWQVGCVSLQVGRKHKLVSIQISADIYILNIYFPFLLIIP